MRVTAPLFVSDSAIHNFIESKMPWIKKHLEKTKNITVTNKPELNFDSGETHLYQGRHYRLQVLSSKNNNNKQGVEIKSADQAVLALENVTEINTLTNNQEAYLFLYTKHPDILEAKKKVLDDWYRQQLKLTIKQWVAHYEPLMQVSVKEIGVKKMKTRWGTCNIQAQRIWLNFELIKKSPKQLEYVVVHEMVHLLEASHNHRFQSFMTQFMPSWRVIKAALNQSAL